MEISGSCKFCGQTSLQNVEKENDDKQADLLATQCCSCEGAMTDQQIKRGLKKIEKLFRRKNVKIADLEKVSDEQISILNDAVSKIAYGEFLNATYQFNAGIKAAISKNAKQQIVVSRTNTRTCKLAD